MSKNIPLTSRDEQQSNDAQISWTTERSWYSQEFDGLNPDWLELRRLLSSRDLSIELNSNFSKILPQIGKGETGL